MKLTVIGSTGGIGRALVEQALAQGHDVTAVARNPAQHEPEVRLVRVDLMDAVPGRTEVP